MVGLLPDLPAPGNGGHGLRLPGGRGHGGLPVPGGRFRGVRQPGRSRVAEGPLSGPRHEPMLGVHRARGLGLPPPGRGHRGYPGHRPRLFDAEPAGDDNGRHGLRSPNRRLPHSPQPRGGHPDRPHRRQAGEGRPAASAHGLPGDAPPRRGRHHLERGSRQGAAPVGHGQPALPAAPGAHHGHRRIRQRPRHPVDKPGHGDGLAGRRPAGHRTSRHPGRPHQRAAAVRDSAGGGAPAGGDGHGAGGDAALRGGRRGAHHLLGPGQGAARPGHRQLRRGHLGRGRGRRRGGAGRHDGDGGQGLRPTGRLRRPRRGP